MIVRRKYDTELPNSIKRSDPALLDASSPGAVLCPVCLLSFPIHTRRGLGYPGDFFRFFSVTTFAAWPVIRYRAAMSFWNFGGLLYVAGGFLMYAFCELFLKFV
jgi:hypothetical protein